MTRTIQMTEGSLFKNMFIFSLPLVFTNLLEVFFNIADIAVVGRFAGTMPLGSVGSTSNLLFFFTGMLMGMGGGVNSIVAYHIGTKNRKNISDAVHTSLVICLIIGVVLAAGGIALSRPVLILCKTKPELLDGAVTYLSVYLLGMPGLAVYNYGNGVLAAAGDTRRPLYFLTVSGVLNVLLNLLFVIVFKMSCAGVALASAISVYLSAVLVLAALKKGLGDVKLEFRKLKVNGHMAVQVLKIGIPSGLQNATFAVANTFVQSGVNSFDANMVAGTAASLNLDNIVYGCISSFYTACASFVSQNYGAGKKDRILKTVFIGNFLAVVVASLFGVIIGFFGPQLLGCFTKDPAVVACGMERLKIMVFSYPVAPFMDNTIAANRGLGKTFVPSIIVLMGSCLFRILWIYTVFAYFKTIPALFLLYIFSWALTAVAEIGYFIVIYKKTVKNMVLS